MDSYYDDGGCCIVHPDSTNLILTGGRGPNTQTNWSFVVSYSRDGGAKWTRCNPTPTSAGFCHTLAVAHSQTSVIYAGGEVAGAGAVYVSTDFGSTWAPTATAPTDTVYSLDVDPTDAARVLAATPGGAFLTTNSGATWTNLHGGNLRAALLYPGSPDTLLAGGSAGVAISPDGGTSWHQMNVGLDGRAVTALAFVNDGDNYLIAGTVGGSCYAWQFQSGIAERGWAKDDGRRTLGSLQVWPNPFSSHCRVVGHERDEFTVFDHSGRQVGRASGDRIGAGLAAGVYFVRGIESNAAPLRIVKTK
jgi:WD40 repeat protein